jgi:predicted TIM-barrel fold metal-dependent hydrolase
MYAIDINTCFGTLPRGATDYRLTTLHELIDKSGIAAALTFSLRGTSDDHVAGNVETEAVCSSDPRLIAVATINPLRGIDLERDLAMLASGGFRAVRFDCGGWGQAWSPDSLMFRRILRALAPLHLPILAPAGNSRQIAGLVEATAAAGLPLVLLESAYDTLADVAIAAADYTHVYLDTTRLATPNVIELLLESVSVDRILYGSGAPFNAPQASMNVVFRA